MRNRPQFVIVHHSAGADTDEIEYQRIRWYHRYVRGWRDIGYHRIYERIKGQWLAVAGRPLNMSGAHCPGYNAKSVGVCFVGDFTAEKPDTFQLAVGARDIAGLCDVLGIPTENIIPHRAVRATACPGDAFPWHILIDMVENYRESDGDLIGRTA